MHIGGPLQSVIQTFLDSVQVHPRTKTLSILFLVVAVEIDAVAVSTT